MPHVAAREGCAFEALALHAALLAAFRTVASAESAETFPKLPPGKSRTIAATSAHREAAPAAPTAAAMNAPREAAKVVRPNRAHKVRLQFFLQCRICFLHRSARHIRKNAASKTTFCNAEVGGAKSCNAEFCGAESCYEEFGRGFRRRPRPLYRAFTDTPAGTRRSSFCGRAQAIAGTKWRRPLLRILWRRGEEDRESQTILLEVA